MALHWNIEKIENHEELLVPAPPDMGGPTMSAPDKDGKKLDALTESFIWTSMVTGLGKNWSLDLDFAPEFYARVKLVERVQGMLVFKPDEEGKPQPYYVTPEDVFRRVGLETNVSPVTRAEFIKRMVTHDLDRDKKQAEKHRATLLAATKDVPA